ncbi:flippase [Lacticaseibacillus hegangensis]|uniref:Flippase n=1 Tax=Lacticaseibacillus hegangensis TaxID=2486010 RepID=A0ABW4D0L4_9LACO|nr:flippase [Lacticaseibacillus hegangensis]
MKVLKNFLYNSSYQLLVIMVPLLSTPYIARVIGSHGVGIYSYTNSLTQYFVLVADLGLTMFGTREIAYVRDNIEKRSAVFWGIVGLQICTTAIAMTLFYCFTNEYAHYHNYLIIQGLQILSLATDVSWYFVGIEDFKDVVLRNALFKILSLLLIFTLVKNPSDLFIYTVIMVATAVLGNMTLWPFMRTRVIAPWKAKIGNPIRYLLPSLALFVPQVAVQIYTVLNKVMLGNMISVTSAGIYDYSDKIIRTILAIVTSIGTVLLPHLASAYAKNDQETIDKYFRKAVEAIAFLSLPLAFGLAAIAPDFVKWFLGSDFRTAGGVVRILAPLVIIMAYSGLFGSALVSIKQTTGYTISVIAGCVVNVILNLLLIPYRGINGAAIATIVSETTVTLIQILWLHRCNFKFDSFIRCYRYLLASILMSIFVIMVQKVVSSNFAGLLVEGMLGVFVYGLLGLLLRFPIFEDITQIFNTIRKKN